MADDLADIVWQWAFEHIEELMVPGVATLGTRMYASAKFRTLTWRKKKLRELKRSSDVDVERLGVHNSELVLDEGEDFYRHRASAVFAASLQRLRIVIAVLKFLLLMGRRRSVPPLRGSAFLYAYPSLRLNN